MLQRSDDVASGEAVRRGNGQRPLRQQPGIHPRQLSQGWHGVRHRRPAALLPLHVLDVDGQRALCVAHCRCHILR